MQEFQGFDCEVLELLGYTCDEFVKVVCVKFGRFLVGCVRVCCEVKLLWGSIYSCKIHFRV